MRLNFIQRCNISPSTLQQGGRIMLFHISRRTLIKAGAALPAGWFFTGPASSSHASPAKGLKADVIIAGGGVGGCAAALSACRLEKKVVLIEPTAGCAAR